MDEVITCVCGNQSWILGTCGCRCNVCNQYITTVQYEVHATNVILKDLGKSRKETE